MASFTETPKLSGKYTQALQFAAEAHQSQIRKQGEIPYISHLMSVSALVIEAGGMEEEAIAALLHDYIEDINPVDGADVLHDKFGLGVAYLVESLSADSHNEYITTIYNGDDSVKLISCADKLHNLRGYSTTGLRLWSERQAGFYAALMPIYESCDRVPRHWINEMRLLLRFLKIK